MLEPGQKAPNFILPSHSEATRSLEEFKGKNVILYFYPKDDTPGCTLESCGFRDHYEDFIKKNALILGVSRDSPASHRRFRDKYNLPFDLLSDESGGVCQAYGVWGERSMYGKTFFGILRSTFLIDTQGVIKNCWYNVKVPGHIPAVLTALS